MPLSLPFNQESKVFNMHVNPIRFDETYQVVSIFYQYQASPGRSIAHDEWE